MTRLLLLLACLCPGTLLAQSLTLPGNADQTFTRESAIDSHMFPSGVWADGVLPMRNAEGALTQTAWRIDAPGITTLQLLRPLRGQLTEAGFAIVFECQTDVCGGYDFRFGIDVVPPPDMQVNLADFRYLHAAKDVEEAHFGILVSRTAQAGYVQITRVGPPQDAEETSTTSRGAPVRAVGQTAESTLAAQLDTVGHAVLDDLQFATGSAQLNPDPYPSLQQLADYLETRPDLTIALVGHTDASGSLDGNIALSKRRAGSVLERLATTYNIPRRQMEAQGMGYLAPVDNNRTEAGRAENRRVEVIVTTTENP